MSRIDTRALRELAEAAQQNGTGMQPVTVIALLNEIEALSLALDRCPSPCMLSHANEQLAAVTAARDAACDMIQKLVDAQERYSPAVVATSGAFAAMKREIDRRIAELRKVGTP